jgi:mannose-6-phosphate isomerase
LGLDGTPRALHVRESLESLAANTSKAPVLVRSSAQKEVLAECREFRIRRERLGQGGRLSVAKDGQPRILSVVTGELEEIHSSGVSLKAGDNLLLPYAGEFSFVAKTGAVVLVTENFSQP